MAIQFSKIIKKERTWTSFIKNKDAEFRNTFSFSYSTKLKKILRIQPKQNKKVNKN